MTRSLAVLSGGGFLGLPTTTFGASICVLLFSVLVCLGHAGTCCLFSLIPCVLFVGVHGMWPCDAQGHSSSPSLPIKSWASSHLWQANTHAFLILPCGCYSLVSYFCFCCAAIWPLTTSWVVNLHPGFHNDFIVVGRIHISPPDAHAISLSA